MTDHAAEAQRILAHLNAGVTRMNAECADNILPAEGAMAPDVTASALLAIAHTLQAIHQLMDSTPRSVHTPCPNVTGHCGPWEIGCSHPAGHDGPHNDERLTDTRTP